MTKRYVIEGEWSGYTSSQSRICHRVVTQHPNDYKKIQAIQYTDGTCLYLTVRPCLPRERIKEIHGYDSLIKKFIDKGLTGFVKVEDLYK